ncbi:MAG TPA: hypothetical protein VI916_12920 [Acidimicrobiia bacterium]|nr:hypothetical protein [Acidimicrobiia bacterium]
MTVPFVLGPGPVADHVARQLAATGGIDRVVLAQSGETDDRIVRVDWRVDSGLPDDATVVVSTSPGRPGRDERAAVAAALDAGLSVVSASDDHATVERLFDLDVDAATAGSRVVVGAGLAPGLSEVLASYAASALDNAAEVHVARFGAASAPCRRALRRAAWGRVSEVDAGSDNVARAGTGRRLVAFPPPVGTHDCRRVVSAIPTLVARVLPQIERVTVRQAMTRPGRLTGRPPLVGGSRRASFGAVHVEVRGTRGAGTEILTIGAVDHHAAITGAVLACGVAVVSGLVRGIDPPSAGAAGFAEMGPPSALLADLRRRGVRAARFAGI